MKIVVTGGAGFIGSAVIRHIIKNTNNIVTNIDKLTYAGNLDNLASVSSSTRYSFLHEDICDLNAMKKLFFKFQPDAILHLAAESHVDKSIIGPSDFIKSNIIGTYTLLETARSYFEELPLQEKINFRFHHISTDEVYGDLGGSEGLFLEDTPYSPSSPYSASKASSDHLVRAWNRTYGLPTVITNCSNNYGPYHFPEKLIPLAILNALQGSHIPIYGDGSQVRDWLFVDDHACALYEVLTKGEIGETYNIGGNSQHTNIDVVKKICKILEKLAPQKPEGIKNYSDLIRFVNDRPGHDSRYAIDTSKIEKELGWRPKETFETGIEKTVRWYLDNNDWYSRILDGSYKLGHLGEKTL